MAGSLDCLKASIKKIKQTKEWNFKASTNVGKACVVELGKSIIFKKFINDPNSPYSKWLKDQFKNKTMRSIQEAIMDNLNCTYQDTYDILRLIPSQILDSLIKGGI